MLIPLPALEAQGEGESDPRKNWVDHLYPFFYYSSIDGFWFAGHYDWSSPMGFVDRPEPNFGRLALDVGASTQGSYAITFDGQVPAYWDGWRLGLTLTLARANRFGYYGQGNNTHFDSDSTAGRSYFYRVSRQSIGARATLQRRVAGPMRVLFGATIDRTDFRDLPGESVFQRDRVAGTIGPDDDPFSDAVARTGVVFDTRDLEVDPHRGIYAEALFGAGRGYSRTTGQVRLYLHPLERLVLAARLGAEGMSGTPPLAVQLTMESSDGPIVGLGGARSLRGYHDGRFVGPGKLIGSVEARYGLIWAPRLLEVKLFAFYDAGRVFGRGESVRLTRHGLHAALGGGVAVSMMRNTLFTLSGGKGTEGAEVAFSSSWSY
ncbi:MAG TPA: BamA/TamA family outer membrane protein [Gemmatimonadales bacterium]|nr:BamA/TamA family outer membrane protein [Gemmatimonadales bacterium]